MILYGTRKKYIRNISVLVGSILLILFMGINETSYAKVSTNPTVLSIERQTPSDSTTDADEVTFRVTFSENVARVSPDDFVLNGTIAGDGTIASITRISDSVFDVNVTGITNSEGTLGLDIAGVEGAGSNNIIELISTSDANESGTYNQDSGDATQIGQSFEALNTGLLHSVSLNKHLGFHSYSGTATIKIFSGQTVGGTPLATQEINVTSSSGFETYVFEDPPSVTAGVTYTWSWEKGTGSGSSNFIGTTSNPYADGVAYVSTLGGFSASIDFVFQTQVITDTTQSLAATLPGTDQTYAISNPPLASNVSISGDLEVGEELTGSYDYSDPQSDSESGTTFKWYRSDDSEATNKTEIAGATSTTYTTVEADENKYLSFEVTPGDGTNTGTAVESDLSGPIEPLFKIVSISRQSPSGTQASADESITFRVVFNKNAFQVTTDDFIADSTSGGSVTSVTKVDNMTYDVSISGMNTTGGIAKLSVKGVAGTGGSNDITEFEYSNGSATISQTNVNDYLNQAKIGQSFEATSNNYFTAFTVYPESGQHTFSGSADLKVYSKNIDEDVDASLLTSQTIDISSSTDGSGQTFSINNPPALVSGQTYSFIIENFSGSGSHALSSSTSGNYSDGRVIFTGNNSGHSDFDLKFDIFEGTQTAGSALQATAPTTEETFTILPVTSSDPAKFTLFNTLDISTSADGIYSVFAIDVDGDGDVDVLSASSSDNKIAWYENDGSESFMARTITTSADGARSVFAIDVDGDGDVDVLSASYYDDKIAWYENDGSESFTARTITTSADRAHSVYAIDVDGDGDVDVLSANYGEDKIAWYENDGSENFTDQTITSSADGIYSVFAIDVDGDGDVDVLSASSSDDKIAWYENNGSESFTTHTITTSADGARSVFAIDVDGDGDVDVLSASQYDDKIAWYENNGSESFMVHTITTSADRALSVYAIDVDGDGDVDVLSASLNDDKIAWYENDGSENFTAHTITTSADGARSVYAIDVDGDGDVDVLSANSNDDKIAWYKSESHTFAGGAGTTSNPYHVSTPTDLHFVRAAISDKFIVTANIDMNVAPYNTGEGWDPIGLNSREDEFQGVFDGNGFVIKNLYINRPTEDFVGLFGATFGGEIKNVALEDVDITGGSFTGALVGINYTDVQKSYAKGSVSAANHSGGLVGTLEDYLTSTAEVTDSYSLVNLTSSGGNFGGLVGRLISGTISTSYAAGSVTGGTDANGGLVGLDEGGTVTNSYWDTQTTGQASSAGGTGYTTAQMRQSTNFTGFDFANIWVIDEGTGYPGLNERRENSLVITGNEGWRMLSAPVTSTSYGTLLDSLWTQGFTGADVTNGTSNVLVWNEATKAFQSISNATDVPSAGTGFIAYIYADDNYDGTPDDFPKVLTNSASQFTGSANPTLTFTDSGTLANDGWNLLGNPYGTSIDWDGEDGWEKTNLDGTFYVWSDSASGGAGSYLSWNGATGTLENGKIAPWQGFWVKANAASPGISMNDSVRSTGGTLFKRKPVPQVTFKLFGNEISNSAIVMFHKQAEAGKDELDAYKLQPLNSEYLLLGTSATGLESMDIQSLPLDGSETELELDIQGSNLNGEFKLTWNQIAIPDDWSIILTDRLKDKSYNLNNSSSISFDLRTKEKQKAKQNPKLPSSPIQLLKKAKEETPRFSLRIIQSESVYNEEELGLPAYVKLDQNYPNPFNPSTNITFGLPEAGKVTLEVYDVMGRKVASLLSEEQRSAGIHTVYLDASTLASGMYLYRLVAGNSVITKKLTLIK